MMDRTQRGSPSRTAASGKSTSPVSASPITESDVVRLLHEHAPGWHLPNDDLIPIARACTQARLLPPPLSAQATSMIAVTTKARQAVSRAHRSIQELVDALIATLAAGDEWVLADCQRALTSLDALEPHLASRRGRGMQPSPRVALAVRLAAHADVTARFMDEGPDRRRAPGKRRGAPKVSLADEGKLVAFVAALVRLALGARPQDQEGDEIDEDAAIGRAIRRAMPGKVRKRT